MHECNFDESDGPEVLWGILIGLPHHYFPHKNSSPVLVAVTGVRIIFSGPFLLLSND